MKSDLKVLCSTVAAVLWLMVAVVGQDVPPPITTVENQGIAVPKDSVVLMISEDRQSVTAYSETMARTHPLKVIEGVVPVPVAGSGPVGAVCNGNYILAFSGSLGAWDELELPAGDHGEFKIGDESIVVRDKNGMSYHFRASWGQWYSCDEILRGEVRRYESDARVTRGDHLIRMSTIRLAYLSATRVSQMLENMYEAENKARRRPGMNYLTIGRNSLSIHGPKWVVEDIETLIKCLDKEDLPFSSGVRLHPLAAQDRTNSQSTPTTYLSTLPDVLSIDKDSPPMDGPIDIVSLKQRMENEDKASFELVRRLRAIEEKDREEHRYLKMLSESLVRSFRLRQELQQAEILYMKNKLTILEAVLIERSVNETDIVAKRIEQLLDPKLNLEEAFGANADMKTEVANIEKNVGDKRETSRSETRRNSPRQSSASGPGMMMGSDSLLPRPQPRMLLKLEMPTSFRVSGTNLSSSGTSHSQMLGIREQGKCSILLDRIVGYHDLEITIELKALPGKKLSNSFPVRFTLRSQDLERLVTEPLSGLVLNNKNGGLSEIHVGNKDFASDPLNPLNFSDDVVAVLHIRAEKKSGTIVQNESELLGFWSRTVSRSHDSGPVSLVQETTEGNGLADVLSLTIEAGRWVSEFRGNKLIYAAEYDLSARPQRVRLTKLNADGSPSEVVYERLLQFREGDLYSAVRLFDASTGNLESYDDKSAIIETYSRTKETEEGQ